MSQRCEVLVVGGGLSGLAAGSSLSREGVDAILVEARGRFGGRVFTKDPGTCDLGPSWFWPGQQEITQLASRLQLRVHKQYSVGKVALQRSPGKVQLVSGPSSMEGSLRIVGGNAALVDGLVREIPEQKRFLNTTVVKLVSNETTISVECSRGDGRSVQIEANRVALALPPRLSAKLLFEPALPTDVLQDLRSTPTWMASTAKFFAVYKRAFWREAGLCGSAVSLIQGAPLREIHDASPDGTTEHYALFGFAGLNSDQRAEIGTDEFVKRAVRQLGDIFGDEATRPVTTHFQDWSQEEYTCGDGDQADLNYHPCYGVDTSLSTTSEWHKKLLFISSETTSGTHGGLMEGALRASRQAIRDLTTHFPGQSPTGR